MKTHVLKTAPAYFERVWDGSKTFEVRLDDRGYQAGDTVVLREFDFRTDCTWHSSPPPHHTEGNCQKYSGRQITACIGYVLASTPARGQTRGFNGQGYVVFSLCDLDRIREATPEELSAAFPVTPADAIKHVAHAGGLD